MSVHSDDTDVLLLIPPDFFLIPSDEEEDNKKISQQLLFNDLISQVNDLESRLCYIEKQNIVGEEMPFNAEMKRFKHFGSADTLSAIGKSNYNVKNFQLTPQKTQTLPSKFKTCKKALNFSPEKLRKNLKPHQNMLLSNEYVSQKKKDDELLKEVQKFFRVREANDKEIDPVERCSKMDLDNSHLSSTVVNLNKVNDLLKQLEESQVEIEEKLKVQGFVQTKENIDSLDSNQKEIFTPEKLTDKIIENEYSGLSKISVKESNYDTLDPESNVAAETNIENLENDHNHLSGSLCQDSEDCVNDKKINEIKFSSQLSGLLSLCSLWENNDFNKNLENVKFCDDPIIVKQKYQEELCRRQHLEDVIQRLQTLLLEQQQKVAVAIKVDKEKDEAILKLTEGFNKLMNQWKKLENQRNSMAKQLELEREKFENEVTSACQTVKRYEAELSKALDLAHGYKEKYEELENEKKSKTENSIQEVQTLKNEIKNFKEKTESERLKIEKFTKAIAAKEESLSQAKMKILSMANQIKEYEKVISEILAELKLLKLEKENFYEKFKEERSRISDLEESKKFLSQNNEELKKNEKCLKENIRSLNEDIEKIKVELKEFYQRQVEQIVQEKLKEFQGQLATAEKKLNKDLEEKEKQIKAAAMQQVQQIADKHVVEINILEEKHREEIELWRIKIIRSEEKINELQNKLDQYSIQKSEIAQKLQSMMQAQWQEAMKIIKSSSPNNVETNLNCQKNYPPEKTLSCQNTFTMTPNVLGERNLPAEAETISLSPSTEPAFCQEGQITFREQSICPSDIVSHVINETPQKMVSMGSDSLRNYIRMLLERPPGTPSNDANENSRIDGAPFDVAEACKILQWQQILSEASNECHKKPNKKNIF